VLARARRGLITVRPQEGIELRMRLIAMPSFAPDHVRSGEISFYDGVTLAMYRRVQERRSEMLTAAHEVLEAYFDRMALPDPNLFPYRGALTGEYYWDTNEDYTQGEFLGCSDGNPANERLWRVQVTLLARCLGRRAGRSEPADYCGVEVSVVFDPRTGGFECHCTGHEVI
jgi:hypothetical protein